MPSSRRGPLVHFGISSGRGMSSRGVVMCLVGDVFCVGDFINAFENGFAKTSKTKVGEIVQEFKSSRGQMCCL